jgi:glyceraldehyde-3-phosphate dehydrogenase/erythrose-4-phosphate dehydrogenase
MITFDKYLSNNGARLYVQPGNYRQVLPRHRRGRAAAVSLIPASTGAATATERVLPELMGKISAIAVRVPVVNGSLIDITAQVNRDVTTEMVNAVFKRFTEGDGKGILGYTEDELRPRILSGTNIRHCGRQRHQGHHGKAKILVWYDNEYGYARRADPLITFLAEGPVWA